VGVVIPGDVVGADEPAAEVAGVELGDPAFPDGVRTAPGPVVFGSGAVVPVGGSLEQPAPRHVTRHAVFRR
jgi:hypothetical protein